MCAVMNSGAAKVDSHSFAPRVGKSVSRSGARADMFAGVIP